MSKITHRGPLGRVRGHAVSLALCAALTAVALIPSPALGARAPAVRPGVYKGTVQMPNVTMGGSYGTFVLSGTWTLTVTKADTMTGSEILSTTGPFPAGTNCTDSPPSWAVTLNVAMGKGQVGLVKGQPGYVHGSSAFLAVSTMGSTSTPDSYVSTCADNVAGGQPSTFTYNNFATLYGDLSWGPIGGLVSIPVSFFNRVGSTHSVVLSPLVGSKKFTQTWVLTSR